MEFVVDTITAPGPSARPKRTLKSGDSFVVLDSHGDIGASADGSDGFFHCDTRYLSRLELRFNRMAPLLLGSNVSDDNSILTVDLTNPDTFIDNQLVLKKDRLHIVRTTFVWSGNIYQRLGLRNHGEGPIDFELSVIFASDFADIFEVRGFQRAHRGTSGVDVTSSGSVELRYDGFGPQDAQARHRFRSGPDAALQAAGRVSAYACVE